MLNAKIIKCNGEAHKNPFIDHCGICMREVKMRKFIRWLLHWPTLSQRRERELRRLRPAPPDWDPDRPNGGWGKQ